jgi:hypothetical protein
MLAMSIIGFRLGDTPVCGVSSDHNPMINTVRPRGTRGERGDVNEPRD